MQESVRLGRIAGVSVGVNWTVLVIFGLILIGLSTVQFPLLFEGRPIAAYWVAGTVAALAFFASLLAHELAHAVVARRHGVEVDGIVLWLFGGVARLRDQAPDPTAELRIAGVGPLVSVVLGVAFGAVALTTVAVGGGGLVVGVLGWLSFINLALAGFNLVPAAPLDGGRILRALVWRVRGDRVSAAVTAARAGRIFGILVIALGGAQFVLTPGIGGLWLILIGWFLTSAASAEEQQARVQGSLAGIRVQDVMTADPVTVPPDLTVAALLDEYVLRNRFSAFPVVDEGGRLLGLATLSRIKQIDASQRSMTRVSEVSCGRDEVALASPGDALNALLPRLGSCADGRAVVLDDGRVVGIVSPTDVARMLELAHLRGDGTGSLPRAPRRV